MTTPSVLLYSAVEATDHITRSVRAEIMQLAVLIGHTVGSAADDPTRGLAAPPT